MADKNKKDEPVTEKGQLSATPPEPEDVTGNQLSHDLRRLGAIMVAIYDGRKSTGASIAGIEREVTQQALTICEAQWREDGEYTTERMQDLTKAAGAMLPQAKQNPPDPTASQTTAPLPSQYDVFKDTVGYWASTKSSHFETPEGSPTQPLQSGTRTPPPNRRTR